MHALQCDACLRKIKAVLNDNPEHSTAHGSWRISDRKATFSFGYLGGRSIAFGPSYVLGNDGGVGFSSVRYERCAVFLGVACCSRRCNWPVTNWRSWAYFRLHPFQLAQHRFDVGAD